MAARAAAATVVAWALLAGAFVAEPRGRSSLALALDCAAFVPPMVQHFDHMGFYCCRHRARRAEHRSP